jgi:triacylglycerol esterase/lipase EstA (alpha/beta hydrolase family)
MVTRLLAAVMAVQLLATLLFWYLAARWMAPDLALMLALAVVLAVRMAITANNFRLARRFGITPPDEHAHDWPARLRMFFTEYAATMRASSWTMLRHRPRMHLASEPRGLPVLLVHGYGCNGGYWAPLAQVLTQERISHATVDLEPVTGDIDAFAGQVQQAVQRLCQASGSARVILVCHSMGGLVARAYLRHYGAQQVARVITLGTPHHGTALASFGVGSNARQMQRGGEWLAQLDAADRAQRRLVTSIYSYHDNIIAPQDSSHLPGAHNIAVGGIGHVALGVHSQIIQRVVAEILSIT